MNKYYNFEIYTKNPISGICGWDIQMISVKADTPKEAGLKLREYPHFDDIILFNYTHEEEETADFLAVENYPIFKILNRITIDRSIQV